MTKGPFTPPIVLYRIRGDTFIMRGSTSAMAAVGESGGVNRDRGRPLLPSQFLYLRGLILGNLRSRVLARDRWDPSSLADVSRRLFIDPPGRPC